MAESPDAIAEIIYREDWRREMAAYDAVSTQRLLDGYQRLEPAFEARANAMVAAISRNDVSSSQAFRDLPEYTDFLATIKAEMDSFARILAGEIAAGERAGIEAGLSAAERMVNASAGVNVSGWVRPDAAAVRAVIGYADSAAMQTAISQFGLNATQNINDLLIAGIAQGRNPLQIAQLIADWKNVPFAWAENMSRTTMIYAARDATHEGFRANPDIVTGWMWLSAKDKRTCVSCWANDGRIFPISQNLNDHHRGRCTAAPITRYSRWHVGYTSGRERFAALSEAEQREIFHNHVLYDAWRRGDAAWDDLSEPYENDIFGTMLRAASFASIERRR